MPGEDPPDIFSDEGLRKKIYESSRKRIESLWYAAFEGDVDGVREILEAGYHDVNGGNRWQADIDPNGWQRTPLHAAVLKRNLPLAKMLLSEGADVNRKTKYGDTPLHFAVEGRQRAMVGALLSHGADPPITNDEGDSPLKLAKDRGFTEIEDKLRKPKDG